MLQFKVATVNFKGTKYISLVYTNEDNKDIHFIYRTKGFRKSNKGWFCLDTQDFVKRQDFVELLNGAMQKVCGVII